MIKSKMTGKAQTTISQPARSAGHLGERDDLAYHIEGEQMRLTEPDPEQIDDPFTSFREWWSEVDRRAFGDL